MQNIYQDIANRTQGDIYIGVVGPVRTGKSTFIKRFMDEMVIPNMDDLFKKERAKDELPQSADGKTIMTTEPKFIPSEAAEIKLDEAKCKVRLVDCVGYMVNGAIGAIEDGNERIVQTPWSQDGMPFTVAAEMGTNKVITEHSTIGLVVTTDGSITDIDRDDYVEAEQRVINELKQYKKPFVILLNSRDPSSERAKDLREELQEKYGVPVMLVSCANLDSMDISRILETVLYEFPLKEISIDFPSWFDVLPNNHKTKMDIFDSINNALSNVSVIRSAKQACMSIKDNDFCKDVDIKEIDLGQGTIRIEVQTVDGLFNEILSELTGFDVSGDDKLLSLLINLKDIKQKYEKIEYALKEVEVKGYGIVSPGLDELKLEEPEIVKHGSRFGVRLRASAPSIHMIRADIETEVSPIVGSEKQSEELINYLMSEFTNDPIKIWESNIFGKSLHDLVNEGLHNKLSRMPDDAREKMQETLQRIINEGSGGLICIIL